MTTDDEVPPGNTRHASATAATSAGRERAALLTVEEARARIVARLHRADEETVPLSAALGRVAAERTAAAISHPPVAVSAMDGYALRSADARALPVSLRRVGTARAGAAFDRAIATGECVRIFTGAPMPEGADTVALQEDAEEDAGEVAVTAIPPAGRFIRERGVDIAVGNVVLEAGRAISARALAALAASGSSSVRVRRKPRVALLSTGDELADIGQTIRRGQIVDANRIALSACVSAWGGVPVDMGIVGDSRAAIAAAVDAAAGADLLVTSGGASVGEPDLVRSGLAERGFDLDFWRVAMRPGKPLMFGHAGSLPVLGLPGNPVSALVCALLFLRPALRTMLGLAPAELAFEAAYLASPLPMNDQREDYLRAVFEPFEDGRLLARPLDPQDSIMLSRLAHADGLIRRRPLAPAAALGARVEVVRFATELGSF